MKKYFSKLFCIKNFFDIRYYFDANKGLKQLDGANSKRSIANVCIVERDAYWYAERHYANINIVDLPKIMKAEVKNIAPFSGSVFWKVKSFTTNKVTILYFVIPSQYMEVISKHCQLIYPVGFDKPSMNALLTLDEKSESLNTVASNVKHVAESNIFKLAGFYITKLKSKTAKSQILTTKKLAIFAASSVLFFTLASSLYLTLTLSYYQNKTTDNRAAVESALEIQRELKSKSISKQAFDKFSTDNRNVLALFSHLNLQDESYEIRRIHLHPKGIKISGTTTASATNILSLLLNSPTVSEAKFSRPVSKNRAGDEVFEIEVVFS